MSVPVRIVLHDRRLADCIDRFNAAGTYASVRQAADLGSFVQYLQTMRNEFNRRLPLSDMRASTIDEARQNDSEFQNSFSDSIYSRNTSLFLQSMTVISLLCLLHPDFVTDVLSHVCEIRWRNGKYSALAFYLDPPPVRSFLIWWIGPSSEVARLVQDLTAASFDWHGIAPSYVNWARGSEPR